MPIRTYVPSPLPKAPRWPGLVASVGGEAAIRQHMADTPSDGGPDRWEAGFESVPWQCATQGGGLAVMPCNPSSSQFEAAGAPDSIVTDPWLLWEMLSCSTMSQDALGLRARVENLLTNTTSHRIEDELWNGTQATAASSSTQWLGDSNVTMLSGTPGVVPAFARLQAKAAAAAEGNRLMIHCSPLLAAYWEHASLIYRDPTTGLVLDHHGNLVVVGTGYGDPDDDDTSTAYATTMVNVRLSEVFSPDNAQTRYVVNDNVDVRIASRVAAVSWDGCVQYGVTVDTTSLGFV